MLNPKPGEIWLVRFPFSDLTSTKVRPALVLANHRQDVIILGIFSKVPPGIPEKTWVLINDRQSDFTQTGLAKTSILRAEKIATAHQSTFQRKLGTIPNEFQSKVINALKHALNF